MVGRLKKRHLRRYHSVLHPVRHQKQPFLGASIKEKNHTTEKKVVLSCRINQLSKIVAHGMYASWGFQAIIQE